MSYNYWIKGEIIVTPAAVSALRKSPEEVVKFLDEHDYLAEVDYDETPARVKVIHLGTIHEHNAVNEINERLAKLSNLALGHLDGDYSIIDENEKLIA